MGLIEEISTIKKMMGLLVESKATEATGLAILKRAGFDDAESVIKQFAAGDRSQNQKNIPLMAVLYVKRDTDITNIIRVMNEYNDLETKKRIKPISIVNGDLKIEDKVFNNFIKFSEHIHAVKSVTSEKPKKNEYSQHEDDVMAMGKPMWSGNGIDIYNGDGVGKCIKYTTGGLTGKHYSFCIGQPGNTMYQSYRDTQDSSFYFIIDKNRMPVTENGSSDLSDPLHIVVYDNTIRGVLLTDANNTTGTIAEYGKDVNGYKDYLKSKGVPVDELLINRPRTEQEKAEQIKLGNRKSNLRWFVELTYDEKSKYIGRGHRLTDQQFDVILNDKDLLRQYVDHGVKIYEQQFNKLNSNLRKTYLRKRLMTVYMLEPEWEEPENEYDDGPDPEDNEEYNFWLEEFEIKALSPEQINEWVKILMKEKTFPPKMYVTQCPDETIKMYIDFILAQDTKHTRQIEINSVFLNKISKELSDYTINKICFTPNRVILNFYTLKELSQEYIHNYFMNKAKSVGGHYNYTLNTSFDVLASPETKFEYLKECCKLFPGRYTNLTNKLDWNIKKDLALHSGLILTDEDFDKLEPEEKNTYVKKLTGYGKDGGYSYDNELGIRKHHILNVDYKTQNEYVESFKDGDKPNYKYMDWGSFEALPEDLKFKAANILYNRTSKLCNARTFNYLSEEEKNSYIMKIATNDSYCVPVYEFNAFPEKYRLMYVKERAEKKGTAFLNGGGYSENAIFREYIKKLEEMGYKFEYDVAKPRN
jgi:hypothetical protein